MSSSERLGTGVSSLDALLGGGVETDSLTEVYGEGGTGKTIFCLQLAVRVALGGRWVFYIDTEGLSADKLAAMTGDRLEEAVARLLLSSPGTMAEQTRAVRAASRMARSGDRPVGLIVLDSATLHYRVSLGGPEEDTDRAALGFQLAELLHTALRVPVPVVFTNQVFRSMAEGTLEPLGGAFVGHAAKTILRFDRLTGDRRRALLLKHRSQPEGTADFRIGDRGLA
jgi:DNA repair protein RadB